MNTCAIKSKLDWENIKNVSQCFTEKEYEYACFHNFLALEFIPREKQTVRMIKLAFRPQYETLSFNPHSGMTCGNYKIVHYSCRDKTNENMPSEESINAEIIKSLQKCTNQEELFNIRHSKHIDFFEYIPKHLICLDTFLNMLDMFDHCNKNNSIIELAQNNGASEEDIITLKIADIFLRRNGESEELDQYIHIITHDMLKQIAKIDNPDISVKVLEYLKPNLGKVTDVSDISDNNNIILNSNYDIEFAYELIKSNANFLNLKSYFKSKYFLGATEKYTSWFSCYGDNRKFLTAELELKLLKEMLATDANILYDLNHSKKLSYDLNDVKYYSEIDEKNLTEQQDQQMFLEYFEIAKQAPNFSIRHIPKGMIYYEGIHNLCKELAELNPENLWYLTEYRGCIDLHLDDMEEFYKKILRKKTFYVFLLTKKYRTFEMYNISIDTYIESLARGENSNLYSYDENENVEWFNPYDWLNFFDGHNNLTDEELLLLAKKLVRVNGLFLRHISKNIQCLPEQYKSEIISAALEQNGMALLFCSQTYDRCMIAVKSNSAIYDHIADCYKTTELLDLAIENAIKKF